VYASATVGGSGSSVNASVKKNTTDIVWPYLCKR